MSNAIPAGFRIEPLSDRHNRSAFSCGVDALDRYFHAQARQDSRRRVASCFVLIDTNETVAGYYTLSATSIALIDLPASVVGKLPRYPAIPATLMGRLAVDTKYRGRRLGELLLLDAFSRTLRSEIASYAFVVDAKDETAEEFYERYGFAKLPNTERRLFLPFSQIASIFA